MLILNELVGFGGGFQFQFTTWDPAKTGGSPSLSNGNLSVQGGGSNWNQVLSIAAIPSGAKVYVEFTINIVSAANNFIFGVITSTDSRASGAYIGTTANAWSWQPNVQKWHNNSYTALASGCAVNDVMMLAVDMGAGGIWFGRNGTWREGNPSAGTGASYTGLSGTLYVAQSVYTGTDKQTANFGSSAFTYTPPTGFSGLAA